MFTGAPALEAQQHAPRGEGGALYGSLNEALGIGYSWSSRFTEVSAMQGASNIARAPEPLPGSVEALIVLLAVLELLAAWVVVGLWRERGRSLAYRLAWSAMALVPVVGLVACAVWRDPPPPHGPTDRPGGRDWSA